MKQDDKTPADLLKELCEITGTKIKHDKATQTLTLGDLDSLPADIRQSIEQDIKDLDKEKQ